jgi:hypothetical protein
MSYETTTTDSTATDANTTATTDQTASSAADTAAEKDWQAEAEKWKAFARKHEDAAKANADKAKRFDEFEESQKTELQKAADRAAAAEAKAAEIEARAIRAEVAAAKGVPATLLSGSTQEELEASADALIAFRGEKPKPDFGGGDRGTDVAAKGGQLGAEDVKRMTPDQIVEAKAAGRLNDYLGVK